MAERLSEVASFRLSGYNNCTAKISSVESWLPAKGGKRRRAGLNLPSGVHLGSALGKAGCSYYQGKASTLPACCFWMHSADTLGRRPLRCVDIPLSQIQQHSFSDKKGLLWKHTQDQKLKKKNPGDWADCIWGLRSTHLARLRVNVEKCTLYSDSCLVPIACSESHSRTTRAVHRLSREIIVFELG